jgi:TRAP-type C4-dicarboxylate transport system permease small subunit
MNAALNKLFKFFEMLMAALLGAMVTLVLLNVILRYVFNSGITWSEEMARYLFFWLIFVGAVGAMRDNAHLGIDTLLKRLSPSIQKVVYLLGQVLILILMLMLAKGSFDLTMLNLNSKASATNLPLSFIYGTGIFTSICIILIGIANMCNALFVEGSMKELIALPESEEKVSVDDQERGEN